DSIAACLMRRFIPSFPTRRSSEIKATDQIYLHISNLKMQYLPQPALRHLHLDLLRLLGLQRRRWKWMLIYQPYHGLLGKDLDLVVVLSMGVLLSGKKESARMAPILMLYQ